MTRAIISQTPEPLNSIANAALIAGRGTMTGTQCCTGFFPVRGRTRRDLKHAIVRADARLGRPAFGAFLLPTVPIERRPEDPLERGIGREVDLRKGRRW